MSENRAFFRETVERILADTLSQADIEACERRILPAALYGALIENGITLLLVPEAQGGVGGDHGDAMAILRAAGEAAAPGPLLDTMFGQALLARAGLDPIEGLIALAFTDRLDAAFDVPWGGLVDHVLLVSGHGETTRIALSAAPDWTVTPGEDAAGEPRNTLEGESVPVIEGRIAVPVAEILRGAAILRAGQILGAIDWSLRRSIDYAGERRQFGREIAKFQAVQQMLAELADHALASAGIAEAAAEAFSETLVAAARSRLGDAADAAITIAHQVHGAIGFSREYALNQRTRRLMAWRDDFGSVLYWRRTLAASFIGCDRETFWPAVSDAGLRAAA